jgi:MFS transporter, PAT family, beta-lactamase induction signal transducer AmpG
LPAEERGIDNGFMYGSSFAGSFVGGAILGQCLRLYGFQTAIAIQAGILLTIAAFPLLLRERPGDIFFPGLGERRVAPPDATVGRPSSLRQLFALLLQAFSFRSTQLAAVFAVLSLVGVNSHVVFWPVYVQRHLGWSEKEWLNLEGGMSIWFGLAGSVAGGAAASLIGPKRTVVLSLLTLGACWFAYALGQKFWDDKTSVTILFLCETVIGGFLQVAMFAMFMEICWPPVAATQFTAYMAMLNVSNFIGAKLAGPIEGSFGIADAHRALGILQIAMVLIVLTIDLEEVRRSLGRAESADARPGFADDDHSK